VNRLGRSYVTQGDRKIRNVTEDEMLGGCNMRVEMSCGCIVSGRIITAPIIHFK
jgi:hypothetical protein